MARSCQWRRHSFCARPHPESQQSQHPGATNLARSLLCQMPRRQQHHFGHRGSYLTETSPSTCMHCTISEFAGLTGCRKQGQPIQTHHTTCQIPDLSLTTEVPLGRRSLVVHCATGNIESKYITFTWASDPALQNWRLSLRFCPDQEFGYLTIGLLVDGVARPDLVLTQNHFES